MYSVPAAFGLEVGCLSVCLVLALAFAAFFVGLWVEAVLLPLPFPCFAAFSSRFSAARSFCENACAHLLSPKHAAATSGGTS